MKGSPFVRISITLFLISGISSCVMRALRSGSFTANPVRRGPLGPKTVALKLVLLEDGTFTYMGQHGKWREESDKLQLTFVDPWPSFKLVHSFSTEPNEPMVLQWTVKNENTIDTKALKPEIQHGPELVFTRDP